MTEQTKTPPDVKEQTVIAHYDTRLPKLSLMQRIQIPIIGWVVWAVIRILGPTLRFEVWVDNGLAATIGRTGLRASMPSGIDASSRERGTFGIATLS